MTFCRKNQSPFCCSVWLNTLVAIRIINCFSKALPWPLHRRIGAVCLVAETNRGLLLVDTGLGLHDYNHPTLMMAGFMRVMHAARNPDLAVVRQLTRLGYQPGDVKDIVLTHLHPDHAGGLPDFPGAQVHLLRREYEACLHPRKLLEIPYDKADFAHTPIWCLHDIQGERWYDFEAVLLPGIEPEIWLVPLPGHTSGHCGVALKTDDGWVFQCGDCVPANLQFNFLSVLLYRPTIGPHVPRLKSFAEAHPEVRILAGHMWLEWFEKEAMK